MVYNRWHQKGDFDMNYTQYFSIVTDRIKELQNELESIQNKKRLASESLDLQEELLAHKINYLRRFTNLPVLAIIANMKEEELQYMESILNIPKEDIPSTLVRLFQLEDLTDLVNQPLTVTYSEIKDTLLEDYHSINTMISLQQQMFKGREIKANLYGTTLHQNPNSYSQILKDEKELDKKDEELEKAMNEVNTRYDKTALEQLRYYQNNPKQALSMDFILKHKDKVIKNNPKMEKLVNRLTSTGIKGKLSKLAFFRKKNEQEFLNAVIATYQSDNVLSSLGIEEINAFEIDEEYLNLLPQYTTLKIEEERNLISEKKDALKKKKRALLEQIELFDHLEANLKEKFDTILKEKIDYLPLKRIKDQMWYDPNLKDSIITEACLQEQRMLMRKLTAPFMNTVPLEILVNLENYQPNEYTKSKIA